MVSVNSSPVSILDHDILTWTFQLNTYTPETEYGYRCTHEHVSALDTARHTSQVCRSWRQIILRSPTIWANTIDLEMLDESSEFWYKEVMERTGNAKLSIYGHVDTPTAMQGLASLLDENWNRVRRLDILISEYKLNNLGSNQPKYDHFWDIFWQRQAPSLETLAIHVDHDTYFDPTENANVAKLFQGQAPRLRRLHSSLFPVKYHLPWIPQLISVTLSKPLNITHALKVIANTPRLESLVVHLVSGKDEESNAWTQSLHLPNLHRLDISSDFMGSQILLTHISPRSDCALKLKIKKLVPNDPEDDDTLLQLAKLISLYAAGYFLTHRPKNLSIDIRAYGVNILSGMSEYEAAYFGHPEFSVCLGMLWEQSSLDIILSILNPSLLYTVHDLEYSMSDQYYYTPSDGFSEIFRSFTSVERMTVTATSLKILGLISNPPCVLPNLIEVEVYRRLHGSPLPQVALEFLIRQKEAVPNVRIPSWIAIEMRKELQPLEESEGSQVVCDDD